MSKIPPHAARVFKGQIFDIYQWPQQMFDGTTATFEALRRPATTVVIALDGNDIMFAKQEQPGKPEFYSFFGGRVEEGEDILLSAKRELMEEAGLESDDWSLWRTFDQPGKIDWQVHYFIARNCRKIAEQNLDGGEKITVQRMGLTQFLQEILPLPNFSEIELKREIFSAFDEAKARVFCAELMETQHG